MMNIQGVAIVCTLGGFSIGLLIGAICLHPMVGPWTAKRSSQVEQVQAPQPAPQLIYVQVPVLAPYTDNRTAQQVIQDMYADLPHTERKQIP